MNRIVVRTILLTGLLLAPFLSKAGAILEGYPDAILCDQGGDQAFLLYLSEYYPDNQIYASLGAHVDISVEFDTVFQISEPATCQNITVDETTVEDLYLQGDAIDFGTASSTLVKADSQPWWRSIVRLFETVLSFRMLPSLAFLH